MLSGNSVKSPAIKPEPLFARLLAANTDLTKEQIIKLTQARCYRILAEIFAAVHSKNEKLLWEKMFFLTEVLSTVTKKPDIYSSVQTLDRPLFDIVAEADRIYARKGADKTKPLNRSLERASNMAAQHGSWMEKQDVAGYAKYELEFWASRKENNALLIRKEVTKSLSEYNSQRSDLFMSFLSESIYKIVRGYGSKGVETWRFVTNPASFEQSLENFHCVVRLVRENKVRFLFKKSFTFIKVMEKGGKNLPEKQSAMESLFAVFDQRLWNGVKNNLCTNKACIPHRPAPGPRMLNGSKSDASG